MDIWAWTRDVQRELDEAGQSRLADLIDELPSVVVDEDLAQAEAIVPEALALAREAGLPWVEVFVRHWDLQRRDGGHRDLPDAVSLFEFSHREENLGCPQSVCSVQDLTLAYDAADDVGYAPQRQEVSAETLRRIDPSWACWSCISGEHASALVDGGRPQEALDFLAAQRAAAKSMGAKLSTEPVDAAVEAHLQIGNPQAGLAEIDGADKADPEPSRKFALQRALARARCHAAAGDLEAARDALPAYDAIADLPGNHRDWVRVVEQLAGGPWPNDWRVGAAIAPLLAAQVQQGRSRSAIDVAAAQARLALARGARATAGRALRIARAEQPRLVAAHGADELLADLERQLADAPGPDFEVPDTPEELLDALEQHGGEDGPDPELDAEILAAAGERWPDSEAIAEQLAVSLEVMGAPDEAEAALREWIERHPDNVEMRHRLAFTLLDAGRADDADEVAATLNEVDAAWIRANIAHDAERWEEALAQAEIVCESDPEAASTRRLAARAALELHDWKTALTRVREANALSPEDAEETGDDWLAMVPATALGDWETVRACAGRLEMKLDTESGPVDEHWGLIRARFGDGLRAPEFVAERTGPVSARVLEIAAPGAEQHAGDEVVLDFRPIHVPDLEDEQDTSWPIWHVLDVLRPGSRRPFEIDGIHPGEEGWRDFEQGLRDADVYCERRSGESYELTEGDDTRPGIYARVAVPEGMSDAEACALLGRLAGEHEIDDLLWPALADAAGDDELAAHQRERYEQLGIEP